MRSLAILAVLLLASCGDNTRCTVADTAPFRVYTLYFGRSLAAGQEVSDAQWTSFRDSVVTPALPNGYTISDAVGAWAARGSGRTIQERTKVLTVALPDSPDSEPPIQRVRDAYRTQFHQQSVGMTVHKACADFGN